MKVAIIGTGNIGGAITEAIVRKGVRVVESVIAADPSSAFADRLAADGIKVSYTPDNREAIAGVDLIIVAVKPWLMEQVLGELSASIDRSRQTIASIAAGVTFNQLNDYLQSDTLGKLPLYRIIPNTAISLGKSVTFIASYKTTPEQDESIGDLFRALGEVFTVNEQQMTAVTSLSSSGIAYALRYLDAATTGGEQMGIARDEALRIVIATMKGAIAMLETNESQPQEEIDKVTTPGGLTLKGLDAMEKSGFSQSVAKGLLATF